MKTIMLACSSGMSTSMLVQRMKKSADAKGLDLKIFATSLGDIDNQINRQSIDLLLLGPQVKYMENSLKEKYEPEIPVTTVDIRDYGIMNGEKVLETVLPLIGG
ncbi:PTS sugar transporter subunit IIB [Aerococcus urinae]